MRKSEKNNSLSKEIEGTESFCRPVPSQNGFIHLDIKTDNVMIGSEYTPYWRISRD